MPPKLLKHIVILYFERRYPKQNSVIRLKSNILVSHILGWLRYSLHHIFSRRSPYFNTSLSVGSSNAIKSFPIPIGLVTCVNILSLARLFGAMFTTGGDKFVFGLNSLVACI